MSRKQREGILVKPKDRLDEKQVGLVDAASRELLEDPGLLCYNKEAAEVFAGAGAKVEERSDHAKIILSSSLIDSALESAPSKVTLGARNPDNRLILDAEEPRVRFGNGSETNIWLETKFEGNAPIFKRTDGCVEKLRRAAHLADNLENLDFFIRCVNIQDGEITPENKDINMFLASLNNITKHVQAGLNNADKLGDLVKMGEIIAGGRDALKKNPIFSFITCVIKSPLQMVNDTADKLMAINREKIPVVISSSPMAGATAPFDEFGMVAQINAEILAGMTLTQLVSPGTPVLYGSVPVRTRLDNLNDMYGAPEFNHYNVDCAQMARHYRLPCYSTAGVGDSSTPGIQATFEKMLTYMSIPRSGAQYIHYAFGLLERTNVFSPDQAVMDDAHIGIIKHFLKEPPISEEGRESVLSMVREVMQTDHRTYMYHLPLPTRDNVYIRYPLEDAEGGALMAANRKFREIESTPRKTMDGDMLQSLKKLPGVIEKSII